ncbi:hypothetical protein ACFOEK_20595 [Litoribrevibacter euphylliae]|uniref:Uncharacterized protein n=1 Tax=Litoribrevibacter euphylliae TaxID=1834034 RepID=A0ABV7HIJ1_9GAMM
MKPYLVLVMCSLVFPVFGATLTTSNYVISVETHCEEGMVVCDDVSYIGTSKKSGNSIRLKGETWHTVCADGVTPCRFIGYRFKNGDITYQVMDSGVLQVIQGQDKVLLEEQGEWRY